jgi:hypothetical protein
MVLPSLHSKSFLSLPMWVETVFYPSELKRFLHTRVERNDSITRRVFNSLTPQMGRHISLTRRGFDSLTQHAGRNHSLTRMGFNSLTQQVGRNDSPPTRMIC